MICNEFTSLAHVLPFCHLSDEDFDLALYEQQNGAIRFDPDRLENLKFNPLISKTNNQSSLCSDIDPDSNLYSSFSCNYYIKDRFNELILSIYRTLVTPSFGLHRPSSHHVSSIISTQKLIDRVHSQATGIAVPRLAIPQYVHLSYPISVVFAIHTQD